MRYVEEPMDAKLFWLLFFRKIGYFLAGILAGALLLGGFFFVGDNLLQKEERYRTVGEIYLDYESDPDYGIYHVFLGEGLWASFVKSDVFLDDILEQLEAQGILPEAGVNKALLRESVEASLVSDTRVVTTTVTMKDGEMAVLVGKALQQAVIHYADTYDGILGTKIMTLPDEAQPVVKTDRTVKGLIIGAVLGGLVAFWLLSVFIITDDSVRLPSQAQHRYGLPVLGRRGDGFLGENVSYLLRDCKSVAVVPVGAVCSLEETVELLEEAGKSSGKIFKALPEGETLSKRSSLEENPRAAEKIRAMDGVVAVIGCGKYDGKKIEKDLDFLRKQDCPVKGIYLQGADERLLRAYEGPGFLKRKVRG